MEHKKIDLTAFCSSCKGKRRIINPIVETSNSMGTIVKGNCEICKTRIGNLFSQIISQEDLPPLPKEEEKPQEIEEKQIEEYVMKSNTPENKRLLNNYGYTPPMKRSYYNLIKIALFLLAIIVILLVYRTYYSEDFIPIYNSTCEIDCGESICAEIPACVCPNLSCGNSVCEIPGEIVIIMEVNETSD